MRDSVQCTIINFVYATSSLSPAPCSTSGEWDGGEESIPLPLIPLTESKIKLCLLICLRKDEDIYLNNKKTYQVI